MRTMPKTDRWIPYGNTLSIEPFKLSEQLLNMFQMPTYCSEQIDFVPTSYTTDILQYQTHFLNVLLQL